MIALEIDQANLAGHSIVSQFPKAVPSNAPIVIGFGFQARRGKDTAVGAILQARGEAFKVRRYGFADALRQEVADNAFRVGGLEKLCKVMRVPFDPYALPDEQNPDGKQRALLQEWGMWRRETAGPDYWVSRVASAIQRDRPDVALISDVRFRNEFAWIKGQPRGYTVRVERRGFEVEAPVAAHISESELATLDASQWSATISAADGDLEHVRRSAIQIFDLLAR